MKLVFAGLLLVSTALAAEKKPDPAELAALEAVYGPAAKSLGVPDKKDSYHLVAYSLADKEQAYPASYNLGQGKDFSFCDAYLDLLHDVVVKGQEKMVTFVRHAPDKLKVINYLMYSASRAIQGLPHDSDESRFYKQGLSVMTPIGMSKESLAKAGWDKTKAAFDACRTRRSRYYQDWAEKQAIEKMEAIDSRLHALMHPEGDSAPGAGSNQDAK